MCVGGGGGSQAALQGWQSVINFACVSPFLHLFCYFLKYYYFLSRKSFEKKTTKSLLKSDSRTNDYCCLSLLSPASAR